LRCPRCSSIFSQGTLYCTNCGSPLPPTSWPAVAPAPVPSRSKTGLVIGIVLIVLILAGGVGYFLYWNNHQQQLILQAAKTTEQNAADQAPSQIQPTCVSVATDSSHLSYSQYGGFSGYATLSETFGLHNPTNFAIDATWSLTYDYTSVGLRVSSSDSFHINAQGTSHPVFVFTITGQQYNSIPQNPDFSKFTGTIDANYKVVGTYGTYTIPQHESFDNTSSGGGTGGTGSSSSLPSC